MQGSYTTAMPSFARFSSGQLHGLVDYVRLLAMRGETESRLVLDLIDSDSGDLPLDSIWKSVPQEDGSSEVEGSYPEVWAKWRDADENYVAADVTVPRWDQMSVGEQVTRGEHGRELFMGILANCFSCHGVDGRGADAPTLPISLAEVVDADEHEIDPEYEARGGYRWVEYKDAAGHTMKDEDGHVLRDLYRIKPDDWGNPSMPRNFTRSIFRGGSRPIDLYRRIKYGITGTIMPAAVEEISDEDIWDLVIYVRMLANSHDLARVYEHKQAALADRHAIEHGHSDSDDSSGGHSDDGDQHNDNNHNEASGH
jgi:mono/diheme cytochrome c family protein